MKITVIGAGYVGLSTGVCLAQIGHDVTLIDNDSARIAALRAGKPPLFEPFLDRMLAGNTSRLRFTDSYAESVPQSEVIFVAVGTPQSENGAPDLKYLRSAATELGRHLGDRFTVIVNKSTVPVGSGSLVDALVRDTANGRDFCIASNPEFLREGSALHDSLYADRIVIGADNKRGVEVLYRLYRPILDQSFTPPEYLPRPEGVTSVPLVTADLTTAELIKYAANSFLALKVSFINEINRLSSRVGADIQQVARGIGLDRRIGPRFLNAGIGWGGSCFGKDTAALMASASEYGLTMPIVQSAREGNYRQRELVVDQVMGALKILKGKTVALLGLSFKPNTDDLRDAPALDIAARLVERGARVRAHDPIALEGARKQLSSPEIAFCATADEAIAGADAVVLTTEWEEYRQLDWAALRTAARNPLILDGRFFLDREKLMAAGWTYLSLS